MTSHLAPEINLFSLLSLLIELYILAALYDGSGAVILVFIDNPGSVMVVFSYTEDDKGTGIIVVVSVVIDGSVVVLSIVVVDEGAGSFTLSITVTGFS